MTRICLVLAVLGLALRPVLAQDPAITRLAQELQAPRVEVRRAAAQALGRAAYPQGARLLGQALAQERNESIRLEIVRSLRSITFLTYPGYPDALQALARASDDSLESSELVRLRSSEALWEAHKKGLLDPVVFLDRNLHDASPRLRLSAVEMLRKVGTPASIDPLGRAALDTAQPAAVRLAAIEALGAVALADVGPVGRQVTRSNQRSTDMLGVPPLTQPSVMDERHRRQIRYLRAVVMATDTPVTLSLQAVRAMGRVKDKEAIAVLRQVAETHASPAVRQQAGRVLSHVLARQYE